MSVIHRYQLQSCNDPPPTYFFQWLRGVLQKWCLWFCAQHYLLTKVIFHFSLLCSLKRILISDFKIKWKNDDSRNLLYAFLRWRFQRFFPKRVILVWRALKSPGAFSFLKAILWPHHLENDPWFAVQIRHWSHKNVKGPDREQTGVCISKKVA